MKKLTRFIIFCLATTSILSCTDMNTWGDLFKPSLKASFIYFPQSQIELGGSSNLSTSVQLQAVSTPWKISNPATEWLTVSPMEGSGDATVNFTAKENPTSDNIRTAVLSVESTESGYSFSHTLAVNQGKAGSILTPSEQSVEFTREAQKKTIIVKANTDWKATSNVDWVHLTASISSGTLDIDVDANNSTTDRTAKIDITGSASSSITIVQHGYNFDDLISELSFDTMSSTQTFSIATEGAWTATSNESWVQVTPTSGTGNMQLSIIAEKNDGAEARTGIISVKLGDSSKYISIKQKGAYLDISTSSDSEIPVAGGTRAVTFSTSDDWVVECKNLSWVSVEPTNGTAGNCTIVLTFLQSSRETSRTDTTYIRSHNINLQDLRIITTQLGISDEDYHKYVDLGLPSGTLWATMNVGASSSEDYGDYFAWGETSGYNSGKTTFDWSTYKWCNGTYNTLTKYSTTIDNKTELDLTDDAARQSWGGNWKMPTAEQAKELKNQCTVEWTSINGITGRRYISKTNGNSIFLPASGGIGSDGTIVRIGQNGDYWLSEAYNDGYAEEMHFDSMSSSDETQSDVRCFGKSIRPVFIK